MYILKEVKDWGLFNRWKAHRMVKKVYKEARNYLIMPVGKDNKTLGVNEYLFFATIVDFIKKRDMFFNDTLFVDLYEYVQMTNNARFLSSAHMKLWQHLGTELDIFVKENNIYYCKGGWKSVTNKGEK